MNFEIDGMVYLRSQRDQRGIESFGVAYLQDSSTFPGSRNHLIGFFQRAGDGLFNQYVNSGFEQGAGQRAVGLSRDGEADRVNFAYERLPIGRRLNIPFLADCARALIVNVTYTDELGVTLGGERGVDARVLPAQVSDTDYCSS